MIRSPGNSPANDEELRPGADQRDGPDQAVHEPQARARQQVIRQGVAREALDQTEHQQGDADQPVDLARLAEGAGEEDAQAVGEHRGHEEHGGPVVHLPQQQAAPDVEGQAERRRVRLRHRQATEQLVGALVLDLGHRRLEPDGQEDAAQQQDDEGVQRDLTEQERPVVGEHLAQERPGQPGEADPLVGPAGRPGGDLEHGAERLLGCLALDGLVRGRPWSLVWPSVIASLEIIAGVPFKIARAGRDIETTLGDEVSLGVRRDRQLRQRTRGRAEDHQPRVTQVERRLVARAEQVVGLLLPQADRAADVGADLGVAEDAADRASPCASRGS